MNELISGGLAGLTPTVATIIVAGLVIRYALGRLVFLILALIRPEHTITMTRGGITIRPQTAGRTTPVRASAPDDGRDGPDHRNDPHPGATA
jgi:hypothetical protein